MGCFLPLFTGPDLAIRYSVMRDQLEQIRNWLFSKRTLSVAGGMLVAALVLSWAAMRVVEGKLALPDGVESPQAERVASSPGDSKSTPERRRGVERARSSSWYKRPIVKRNIFNPDAVGAETVSEESEGTSDLPVKLIATVVTNPSQFSTALIAGEGRGEEPEIYGVGDELLNEATIEEIQWRRVIIRRDGRLETIPMDSKGVEPAARGGSRRDSDSDADGIEKQSDDEYTVPQSVVDNALEDLDKLASQVRVRPHRDSDGNVDGYRLSAIRRGTLLDKLGIKNGDIVHEVNGYQLNSSSGAMTAFQSLQSESSFQFDVSRRNRRRSIKYDIR